MSALEVWTKYVFDPRSESFLVIELSILLRKLVPSLSSKHITLSFAGDILGVSVWAFWRMLLIVDLTAQIQSLEIIYRDIFLKEQVQNYFSGSLSRTLLTFIDFRMGTLRTVCLQNWFYRFGLQCYWIFEEQCLLSTSFFPRYFFFQWHHTCFRAIIPVNSAME